MIFTYILRVQITQMEMTRNASRADHDIKVVGFRPLREDRMGNKQLTRGTTCRFRKSIKANIIVYMERSQGHMGFDVNK